MRNREKDKYKLPKIHVAGPIMAYVILFVVMISVISYVVQLFGRYALSVRSESERDNAIYWAELYNKASESNKSEILSKLESQGRSYFIADKSGKVIQSNGNITCLAYDESSGTVTLHESEFVQSLSVNASWGADGDEDIDEDSFLLSVDNPFDGDVYLFLDSGSRYVYLEDNILNVDSPSMIRSNEFRTLLIKHGDIDIPLWVGADIGNTNQILVIGSSITFGYNDIVLILVTITLMLITAATLFIVLIANVISNLSAAKKMKKMMFRDNITPNRNWLWYVIKSKEILQKRKNRTKTFAVVELVFIKYRNFVLCHSVKEGNDILRKVYSVITRNLGRNELCAHSSSNGFPLLLEVTGEEETRERLKSLISSLETISANHKLAFRAGVYLVNPEEEIAKRTSRKYIADIDQLYNNACAAGLSIAGSEDSGIAFFDKNLVDQEMWIDNVHERQQKALENEEFLVYYQPKYDPRTDTLRGAEALVRWQTEDMGLVPPGKFIPIFENNGFITELDHYMISHVARDQKRWLDEGKECVPVSVNVSRAHFIESDLADQICDLVDKEGTPHDLIEIELTESAFFDDQKAMLRTINCLKSYGFQVSMDDFGSGYSSLNSLKDMPLDILKLDAGFFRGNESGSERSEIVVSEAIRLAKSLNMKTVAEGVEEKDQVEFLAGEGCDMIQGYYYAKPMPGDEYEKRLSADEKNDSAVSEDKQSTDYKEETDTSDIPDVTSAEE